MARQPTIVTPPSRAQAASPPASPPWADLLAREGERLQPGVNTPLLLNEPGTVWFVEAGGLLVFTVRIDRGEPRGTRTHLLDAGPGECVFGFDAIGIPGDVGVIAVVRWGTVLRRCAIERLPELAGIDAPAVAAAVDLWIERLSASLTRGVSAPPACDRSLVPHVPVELPALRRAAPSAGVVWIDLPSASILYNDLTIATFPDPSALFPLTSSARVMPIDAAAPRLGVTPLVTTEVVGSAAMWAGLRIFQHTALRCEAMNSRLSAAEEFLRLEQKAHHSTAAQRRAESAIGAVLRGGGAQAGLPAGSRPAEPVLWAAQLVGEALGIDLRAPGEDAVDLEFDDRVSLIASASKIKVRQVTLRDGWWHADAGPLLARHGERQNPVALLPAGPISYELVDPATGQRSRVDAEIAAQLAPLAYQFYRPLPDGPVSLGALLRFGARGVRTDSRMLLLTAGAIGLFGTVTPYLTGRIFDAAIPQSDRGMLVTFALALAGVALGTAAFRLVQGIASIRLQARMEASIQTAVWDRLLQLPASFFRRHSAGDLADRAAGVDVMQTLIASVGISAVLGAASGLFFVVQMLTYHATLAWIGIALTLIFVLTTVAINYVQVRYQRREVMIRGRIAGLVLNLISGVTKVRTTGTEPHAFRVWAERFAEQRSIAFRIGLVRAAATTFTTVFPVLASAVLFLVVVQERAAAETTRAATLSTGEFIAFTTAFGLFLAAMQTLGDASIRLLEIVPLYERLQPILRTAPEVDVARVPPGPVTGTIELSRVSFRYSEDGPWILRDVSLQIRPGEFVAFVGDSGCGKSTLLRLLLGFEKCTAGTIYYDGQDIDTLDLRLLRRQMGVVLQVSRVMPTDIYRNIVGVSTRTEEDAWDAAEMAGLADDIRAMPMRMHTYVAEGGSTLSGGQRQRLLIARAIVNRPRLLFLDEATSALDNRTQAIVSESLERLDATRIVIAHRLSTIVNADRICMLDGGRIVEMGSYTELMARDGLFARLANRQKA
jgi:ATP-binding cassette subfamily C protein